MRETMHAIQRPSKKGRERFMQIQRRKGTPNHSMILQASKVENERKRITNAVIATATIIPNRHA
jgi:hypothetical protein